jgi:hypothetical protein
MSGNSALRTNKQNSLRYRKYAAWLAFRAVDCPDIWQLIGTGLLHALFDFGCDFGSDRRAVSSGLNLLHPYPLPKVVV